jgi:hypothetical protein
MGTPLELRAPQDGVEGGTPEGGRVVQDIEDGIHAPLRGEMRD